MSQDMMDKNNDELRQSLAQVLRPDFSGIQRDLESLQSRLQQLDALASPLPEDLANLRKDLQDLLQKTEQAEKNFFALQSDLADPEKVVALLELGLRPALKQGVEKDPLLYGEAIAPMISPAIRNQIRDSKGEMIAALSPIMGQTISKAISEAFLDFRRRIDAQMKHNLNLREWSQRILARMRGVSDADILIRGGFQYTISHVFMIHRPTGLLLKQVSHTEEKPDMDIISGMLTAIRSFVQDAFGKDEDELEGIQYGESNILLKTSQQVYLAAVVEGIYPAGYTELLQQTIHRLDIQHEKFLRNFSGNMDDLPNFEDDLRPLLNPSQADQGMDFPKRENLSQSQKKALRVGLGVLIITLALLVFACIFTYRLLPVAFPAPTLTPQPSSTITPLPSATRTSTPLPSATSTVTYTPTFTNTPPSTETAIPVSIKGVITGNVWVHQEPSMASKSDLVVVYSNTVVDILASYNGWIEISWTSETGIHWGWVSGEWVGITEPIPDWMITPVP
jgi:hypothetical protein